MSLSIILLRVDAQRVWPKPVQFSSPHYHKEFADFCAQDQISYHRFLKYWAIPPSSPLFPSKSTEKKGGHKLKLKCLWAVTAYVKDGIPVKAPWEQHGEKDGFLRAQHTREISGVHAGFESHGPAAGIGQHGIGTQIPADRTLKQSDRNDRPELSGKMLCLVRTRRGNGIKTFWRYFHLKSCNFKMLKLSTECQV